MSAVLKFTEITLRDANDAPFSSFPLPICTLCRETAVMTTRN